MVYVIDIKKILCLFILFFVGLMPIGFVLAETENKNLVNIYFFHSDTCSHCQREGKILDSLEERYDNIEIYRFEVSRKENYEIFQNVLDIYDQKTVGVPLTVIGDTSYNGYLEEKSYLEFVKTIEYYSRYGYVDRVSNLIDNEKLPTYEVSEDDQSLEDFMATYGNYYLVAGFYTDDFTLSINAIVLGILSQFNLLRIGTIFLVILLLSMFSSQKNKWLFLLEYLILSFLWYTVYIVDYNYYSVLIMAIILFLFVLSIFGYIKNREKQWLYSVISILISVLSNCIEHYFYSDELQIFKHLERLYNLSGFSQVSFYISYMFVIVLVNLMLFLFLYSLKKCFWIKAPEEYRYNNENI